MMKAVIDRIENQIAVVLLGEEEIQIDVPLSQLPEGVAEGTWMRLQFLIDEHTSREQYNRNKFLLERIKRKRLQP